MNNKKILSIIFAAALAASSLTPNMLTYSTGDSEALSQTTDNNSPTAPDITTATTALVTTQPTETTSTTTTDTTSTTTSATTTDTTSTTTSATTTDTTSTTTSAMTTDTTSTTTSAMTTDTTSTTTTAPTTTATTTTQPAINTVEVEPVCEHIIKQDINGCIYIEIPEGVTAKAEITYSSPEADAHKYYDATLAGGKTYSLKVEGRDTTEDDFRLYTLNVQLSGGKFGTSAAPYTDSFNIADPNDNPDSFKNVLYKFTVDDAQSDSAWNVIKDTENEKEIAVHLDYVVLGDVNDDLTVNSADASAVLAEYASLSTGGQSTFTDKLKTAADVNKDGSINSSDASLILAYYAESSTGGTPSWDQSNTSGTVKNSEYNNYQNSRIKTAILRCFHCGYL